jgi:hypothetical protein
MIEIPGLRIIHVLWEGPTPIESADANPGFGLYQLYGTHSIFGPDALLYIGQADANPISHRLSYHKQEWDRWEPSGFSVYVGRLAGWNEIDDTQWGSAIDSAEAVTIFKISPPYNSSRIRSLRPMEPTLVLNHGRRHRLPEAITNIRELVDIADSRFRIHGPSSRPVPPAEAIEEESEDRSD